MHGCLEVRVEIFSLSNYFTSFLDGCLTAVVFLALKAAIGALVMRKEMTRGTLVTSSLFAKAGFGKSTVRGMGSCLARRNSKGD
jgi:hypothetical protein